MCICVKVLLYLTLERKPFILQDMSKTPELVPDVRDYRKIGVDTQELDRKITNKEFASGDGKFNPTLEWLNSAAKVAGLEYKGTIPATSGKEFLASHTFEMNLLVGKLVILFPYFNDLQVPFGLVSVQAKGFVAKNVAEDVIRDFTKASRNSEGTNELILQGYKKL